MSGIINLRKETARSAIDKAEEMINKLNAFKETVHIDYFRYDTISRSTWLGIDGSCEDLIEQLEKEAKRCERSLGQFGLGISSRRHSKIADFIVEAISKYWFLKAIFERERLASYQRRLAEEKRRRQKRIPVAKSQVSAYEVLGIKPGASIAEVKCAYRVKVKETHPDNGGKQSQFILTQRAYEFIMKRIGDTM